MESEIIIDGHRLSLAQSMTLRVALESFAGTLMTDGLGDDERGRAICANYIARIREIRSCMTTVYPAKPV